MAICHHRRDRIVAVSEHIRFDHDPIAYDAFYRESARVNLGSDPFDDHAAPPRHAVERAYSVSGRGCEWRQGKGLRLRRRANHVPCELPG
jgi:hypothetical protein